MHDGCGPEAHPFWSRTGGRAREDGWALGPQPRYFLPPRELLHRFPKN